MGAGCSFKDEMNPINLPLDVLSPASVDASTRILIRESPSLSPLFFLREVFFSVPVEEKGMVVPEEKVVVPEKKGMVIPAHQLLVGEVIPQVK